MTSPTTEPVTAVPRTRKSSVPPPTPRLVADLAGTVIGIDYPADTALSLDAIRPDQHAATVSEFMKLALSGHCSASLGFFELRAAEADDHPDPCVVYCTRQP